MDRATHLDFVGFGKWGGGFISAGADRTLVRARLRHGRHAPHASSGHINILKRALIHTGDFNLGLVMRQLIGVGTPRGLKGRLAAVLAFLGALCASIVELWHRGTLPSADHSFAFMADLRFELPPVGASKGAL